MISAERLRQNDPMWDLLLAYGDARGELALSDLAGGRDEAVAKANVAWEALWAHLRAQGLSQEDRADLQRIAERPKGHHDCDDYSRGYGQCKADMANIAAAILRRLGGQTT